MKRRILLVDDEVTILLTLKAVLEISGFDVDIATSARDGKHKLHHGEFEMVITDMRMESDIAGTEVIAAARTVPYQPAIALLTAFPVSEGDWQNMGADQMLVKPMHTRALLDQIEGLLAARAAKVTSGAAKSSPAAPAPQKKKGPAKVAAPKKAPAKKAAKKAVKKTPAKKAVKRPPARKAVKKTTAKKAAKKTASKARKPAAKKARRR